MTNAVKYLTLDNPYRYTVNIRAVHLLWKYKPGPSQNFDFVRKQLSTALSNTYQNAEDNFTNGHSAYYGSANPYFRSGKMA